VRAPGPILSGAARTIPAVPPPDGPPFTESELADIERWAHEDQRGNLGQQANARRLLRLVEEARWHRALFARVYHAIPRRAGDGAATRRAGA
jgi:hypothetical protein